MEFNPDIEFNPKADYQQLDMLEELLKTSTISEENKEYWYKRLNLLMYSEAENLIEFLYSKQVNRVHAGLNYNATYLNKFLKNTL
jgi:hypothetical protein